MAEGSDEPKPVKEEIYTDIICKGFCRYYKEGREEMHCGGYRFLKGNFTLSELHQLADLPDRPENIKHLIPSDDENLFNLVCDRCDFRADGCDYREDRSGPPCGGYILIDRLVNS